MLKVFLKDKFKGHADGKLGEPNISGALQQTVASMSLLSFMVKLKLSVTLF